MWKSFWSWMFSLMLGAWGAIQRPICYTLAAAGFFLLGYLFSNFSSREETDDLRAKVATTQAELADARERFLEIIEKMGADQKEVVAKVAEGNAVGDIEHNCVINFPEGEFVSEERLKKEEQEVARLQKVNGSLTQKNMALTQQVAALTRHLDGTKMELQDAQATLQNHENSLLRLVSEKHTDALMAWCYLKGLNGKGNPNGGATASLLGVPDVSAAPQNGPTVEVIHRDPPTVLPVDPPPPEKEGKENRTGSVSHYQLTGSTNL
ncbi:MAG: hypothetical protein OXU73_01050 [Candidatus Campbellbacteria bacterium]|nr:hypothetical protein [Candidatus Campbellbacteria bacterium]